MNEIIAKLMFDSWSDRISECRSNRPEDRHLIYEGEGIILDLLLKQDGNGACIHVDGQVLSEDAVEEAVSDQPVSMEQGRHRSSTHTNALGEFSFRAVPSATSTCASCWGSAGSRFGGWIRNNQKDGKSFRHSRLEETE